jgi:ABC-type multidrug transport system fused ATPase/permease subunit
VKNKSKLLSGFIIGTFVSLYLMVSVISTIHVIDFFKLSNPTWLAVSLAIAFEVGAAASLASLIALDKMNKSLVWMLFFLLTAMQAMGNTYYAFVNLEDFKSWSELFGLIEEEEIFQKRVLSIVSGAILPIVALGFIKSLVDYIRPEEEPVVEESPENNQIPDLEDLVIPNTSEKIEFEDISEPLRFDDDLQMLQDEPIYEEPKIEKIPEIEDTKTESKQPINTSSIEVVNVNSNKVPLKRVDMPTDPDINPTRL